MNLPQWKRIANLGDVNPITHGGYFVFVDETGVYAPEAEVLLEPTDDLDIDDPDARWTVHRVVLEPCTFENGVLSDNKFHPEMPAWFASNGKLSDLARYSGQPELELITMFCSDSPIMRAQAWRDVADYHGWENLDAYPVTLTRAEVEARYPEFA